MSEQAKPAEDADVLLCRKIATEAGVPAKESECVPVMKAFAEHNDFDKTASELAKIVGKAPEEVIAIAGKVLESKPAEVKRE